MTAPKTVPVTLTIGRQTYLAGSVPDLGELPDEAIRPLLGGLVRAVRSEIEHAAESIATERDVAAILASSRGVRRDIATRCRPGDARQSVKAPADGNTFDTWL